MLTKERKSLILKELDEKNTVTVQELKEKFNVSESTIRRDITFLSREGKLVKVFGGAVALEQGNRNEELSMIEKETINKEEKLEIAEYAASLILPDDYVYIDSGSTTGKIIRYISEKRATYVTNSITHARDLVRRGLKVFLIGGELKENTEAIVGADAILHIQKYHFSKGFFGANGIDMKLGLTTTDVREALIKRVAVENTQAGSRFILADHDKFGLSSAVTFSDFSGVVVITDRNPGDVYRTAMEIRVV